MAEATIFAMFMALAVVNATRIAEERENGVQPPPLRVADMGLRSFYLRALMVNIPPKRLLTELQASEHDKFAAHLYRSRRDYRSACDHSGKSGKQIERCLLSTF